MCDDVDYSILFPKRYTSEDPDFAKCSVDLPPPPVVRPWPPERQGHGRGGRGRNMNNSFRRDHPYRHSYHHDDRHIHRDQRDRNYERGERRYNDDRYNGPHNGNYGDRRFERDRGYDRGNREYERNRDRDNNRSYYSGNDDRREYDDGRRRDRKPYHDDQSRHGARGSVDK